MPLRTVGGFLVSTIGSPRKSLLLLATGSALGVGGVTALQGCDTIGSLVATAVQVCVPLIRTLLNLPVAELPPGYSACGEPQTWEQNGHSAEFCLYCSPFDPATMYLQLNCQGDYYPLSLRRLGSSEPVSFDEGIHLEKLSCEEQLLMRAKSTYDAWNGRATASFACPNERLFPSAAGYATLAVTVDGKAVEGGRDFKVEFGQQVDLAGSLDEVAHYAMTSGLNGLSFRADDAFYEVAVNSAFSAMMVFRNGVCIDTRFLFAPTP